MKRIFFVVSTAAMLMICGCETVETIHAPSDATNIRPATPADTTKATSQTEGVYVEPK